MNHTIYTMTQPPVPRSHIIQWHNLIRAVWIGGLAVYIIHLNSSDSLHYYLAPTMQKLLLCCPVPLLFIAVIMAWHGLFGRNEVHCDCEHPPPSGFLRSSMVYGLIAIPLLLGFLLPDRALGSSMASQKGMSLTYTPPEIRRKEPLPDPATQLNVQDLKQNQRPFSLQRLPKYNSFLQTSIAANSLNWRRSCMQNRSSESIPRSSLKPSARLICSSDNLQAKISP